MNHAALQRGRRSSRRNSWRGGPLRRESTGFKGAVAHHDGTAHTATLANRITTLLQRGRRSSRRNSGQLRLVVGVKLPASKGPSLITTEQRAHQASQRRFRVDRASKGPSLITTEQAAECFASRSSRRLQRGRRSSRRNSVPPRKATECTMRSLQRGRRSSRRNSSEASVHPATGAVASKGPSLITTEQEGSRARRRASRQSFKGAVAHHDGTVGSIAADGIRSRIASKGPSLITTEQHLVDDARHAPERAARFKGAVAHHDGTGCRLAACLRGAGRSRFKGAVAHHDGTAVGLGAADVAGLDELQRGRRSSRRNRPDANNASLRIFSCFKGAVAHHDGTDRNTREQRYERSHASKGPSLITTEQVVGLRALAVAHRASKGPSLITTEQHASAWERCAQVRNASKGPSLITTEQGPNSSAVIVSTLASKGPSLITTEQPSDCASAVMDG